MKNILNKFKKLKNKKAVASLIAIVVSVVLVGSLSIGTLSFLSTQTRETAKNEINNITSAITKVAEENRQNSPSNDNNQYENCLHETTVLKNVSETYTGDICCATCGIIVQAGSEILAPALREGYLNGIWQFNDELTAIDNEMEENIEFNSNSEEYNHLQVCYGAFMIGVNVNYQQRLNDGTLGNHGTVFSDDCWGIEEYRTITFTSEQQVSMEFWNWFVANATQIL